MFSWSIHICWRHRRVHSLSPEEGEAVESCKIVHDQVCTTFICLRKKNFVSISFCLLFSYLFVSLFSIERWTIIIYFFWRILQKTWWLFSKWHWAAKCWKVFKYRKSVEIMDMLTRVGFLGPHSFAKSCQERLIWSYCSLGEGKFYASRAIANFAGKSLDCRAICHF